MEEELHHACRNGDLNKVIELYEKGVNLSFGNDVALRSSCWYGHIDLVKWLVDKGVDIHSEHDYCLYASLYRGHVELARYLNSIGLHLKNYHRVLSFDEIIRNLMYYDYYPQTIGYLIESNQLLKYDEILRFIFYRASNDDNFMFSKMIYELGNFNIYDVDYRRIIATARWKYYDDYGNWKNEEVFEFMRWLYLVKHESVNSVIDSFSNQIKKEYYPHYKIKQNVDRENYIKEFLLRMEHMSFWCNPMFDENIFKMEIWDYI